MKAVSAASAFPVRDPLANVAGMETPAPAQVETKAAPAATVNVALPALIQPIISTVTGLLTVKDGWKTSECWMLAIVLLAPLAQSYAGQGSSALQTFVGGVLALGYTLIRSAIKSGHHDTLTDLISTLLDHAEETPSPYNTQATVPGVTDVATTATTSSPSGAAAVVSGGTAGGLTGTAAAILAGFLIVGLVGCGTPFANGVADVLQSPANQMIVAAASQAAVVSLESSIGGKVPATMQAPIETAAGAVVNGVAWTGIYSIGQALRTKQGTTAANGSPISASPGVLTAALVNQAGIDPGTAKIVATSVSTIAQQGIPPDIANEAVARLMDTAAAAKAPTGK